MHKLLSIIENVRDANAGIVYSHASPDASQLVPVDQRTCAGDPKRPFSKSSKIINRHLAVPVDTAAVTVKQRNDQCGHCAGVILDATLDKALLRLDFCPVLAYTLRQTLWGHGSVSPCPLSAPASV